MVSRAEQPNLSARELADLSALADGTLPSGRRADVEARIAASPEQSALLARERAAVAMLREARARDRAPASLRARIEAERPGRIGAGRRRVVYGGGLAAALAVAVLALVLILPGGTPGGPSVSQAAGLAALGPAAPAPQPDPRAPAKLETRLEGVYFPDWGRRFGWRPAGQRTDQIGGRSAVTVYYRWRGRGVAYTIVAAPALATPSARVSVLNGTVLRTLKLHGRLVVTWRRAGHTCVLSGPGVPAAELQRLAGWQA
jgi:hypothetical protein